MSSLCVKPSSSAAVPTGYRTSVLSLCQLVPLYVSGHFRRGAMHGLGVYYWAQDKATYFGNWRENSQNGCGVKFYGNGGAAEQVERSSSKLNPVATHSLRKPPGFSTLAPMK
jgi:hypothetical protein